VRTDINQRLAARAAQMAQGSDFAASGLLARLPELALLELDALDHGVVGLCDSGNVLVYNRFEAALSGIPAAQAIGRDFFRELAPCANNSVFRGLFRRGVDAGALDHRFPYTYTLRMRPTHVVLHLYRHGASATNWLLTRRAGGPA